jgi:excisionase family DNA binding protein
MEAVDRINAHMTTTTQTHAESHSALFTPDEAAGYIRVTTRTIRNLTARGILPVTRLSGKIVRYRRTDLEKCIEQFTTGLR